VITPDALVYVTGAKRVRARARHRRTGGATLRWRGCCRAAEGTYAIATSKNGRGATGTRTQQSAPLCPQWQGGLKFITKM
jgi:hypothetical protein